MTLAPETPGQSPEPAPDLVGSSLDDQLAAAERELQRHRAEAAPQLAELRLAELDVRRLRRRRRAAHQRALRLAAMCRARALARIMLAVYGVYAFVNATLLLVHGQPSTEMFIAAAGALGAAAVIPPTG